MHKEGEKDRECPLRPNERERQAKGSVNYWAFYQTFKKFPLTDGKRAFGYADKFRTLLLGDAKYYWILSQGSCISVQKPSLLLSHWLMFLAGQEVLVSMAQRTEHPVTREIRGQHCTRVRNGYQEMGWEENVGFMQQRALSLFIFAPLLPKARVGKQ